MGSKSHQPKMHITYVCMNCGKEYHPKEIDRNKFCSRECAFEYKRAKPKEIIIKPLPVCSVCGKEFEGRTNNKYCSDECKKEKARHDYYTKYADTSRVITSRKCKWCGNNFTPIRNADNYTCCSNECSKQWAKKRDKNNTRRHKNSVSLAKRERIWKRDGYKCMICGKAMKMDKLNTVSSGKPHPLAPTADHIIPQSIARELGWDNKRMHAESNLQSAHFICNVRKGNRAIGEQLRIC